MIVQNIASFIPPRGARPLPESIEQAARDYGEVLNRLPGVIDVRPAEPLLVVVGNQDQKSRLEHFLRDRIDGAPRKVVALDRMFFWAARPDSAPPLHTASRAVERYGDLLLALPGAVHLSVRARRPGPMTGQEDTIVVEMASHAAVQVARRIVRDRLDGVRVSFEPVTCFPGSKKC